MSTSRTGLVVALLLLAAAPAAAQAGDARFSGVVLDAETGEPLPGAHVFLAETMIGTAAGPRGRFELSPAPPGAHRLYASMVGYGGASVDTLVSSGRTYVVTLRLEPDVVELGGVAVEAERDGKWHQRRRSFERSFVGETDFAEETKLVNPEVLAFEGGWGRLEARADSALVIDNHALGYRLRYYLEEFERAGGLIRYDGEPVFEPLVPTDSVHGARWDANRRRAFRGSFRHFLLTLLHNRAYEEGFVLYRRSDLGPRHHRWRADPDDLVRPDSAGTWLLDFHGYVEIIYTGEEESRAFTNLRRAGAARRRQAQHSWIRLDDGPARIDQHGEPLDPYGVTVGGYFAFESVAAEMLPKEYEAR